MLAFALAALIAAPEAPVTLSLLFRGLATQNPADDWTPYDNSGSYTGVWGTDFQISTTSVVGPYSIQFVSGTPAGAPALRSNYQPVEASAVYNVWARLRATSVAASRVWECRVFWFTETFTAISDATFFLDELDTADTWQIVGGQVTAPSTAKWARIVIAKANLAFDGFLDETSLDRAARHIRGRRATSDQSINSGAETTIIYNTADVSDGASLNTSTGDITIQYPGTWQLNWNATLLSVADAKQAYTALYHVPFGGAETLITYGNVSVMGAAGNPTVVGSYTMRLGVKDVIRIKVFHDHGSARNLDDQKDSTFSFTCIDGVQE